MCLHFMVCPQAKFWLECLNPFQKIAFGEIFNDHFIANLLQTVPVKEFESR